MKDQRTATAASLRCQATDSLRQRDPRIAVRLLQQSLALQPGHPGALTNLGAAQRMLGQLSAAIASYTEALRASPGAISTRFNLANALKEFGRFDEAIAQYRRILAQQPDHLRSLNNLGIACKQTGRAEEAAAAFREALSIDPGFASARRNLATTFEDGGDFEAAREAYLAILDDNPDDARALGRLLALRQVNVPPGWVKSAGRLLATDALDAESRAQLHYGLGKYLDRQQRPIEAWPHFRRANAIKSEQRQRSGSGIRQRVDELCEVFTPELFARLAEAGNASGRPLFVVGMPRSGTTLAEQVLASHSRIAGAGELPYFGALALQLAGRPGVAGSFVMAAGGLQAGQIDALAQPYLAELARVSPGAARVVDKMPQNFLYLGLIALLFANARVVHCWRDPRDVCLSCFVEDFDAAHGFASDATEFAVYFREYRRLMAHWKAVLPLAIHDLPYESLVTDFEPTARALLEFAGVDWEERCLRFHESRRTVSTPSRWQVRQPIYSTSIGRWRQYPEYLAPVLPELTVLADSGPP